MIDETDWNLLLSDDADISAEQWTKRFLHIMEECIPSITIKRRKNLPWLNTNIVRHMRMRNKMFQKAKRSHKQQHLLQFKKLRNKVVTMLRQEKIKYFNSLSGADNKSFWKTMKCLNKKEDTIPSLQEGNIQAINAKEKSDMLNTFFSMCWNNSEPPLFEADNTTYSENAHNHSLSLDDLLCTQEQVLHLLRNLDTGKANGPDNISARMLKETASSIAPSLTCLFNLSITKGQLPRLWKTASVVPIPKSSNNKHSPSGYRPISLLPIVSKLLEKHIHSLIFDYLNEHAPVSDVQWGFQQKKSAVTALLSVTQDWLALLDQRKDTHCVFFDLQKAFDTVPHRKLMCKLEKLHLHPVILTWLHNYLYGREQNVIVNGETSDPVKVISGVPQGSVLGPLLFLIYIDDITSLQLSEGTKVSLYADDMLLYKPISSDNDYVELQHDIDQVHLWSRKNGMQFNVTKCKCMLLSRKRISAPPALYLNTQPMEVVQSYKYLGVVVSSDLSWSSHIQLVCMKAKKILGLIYRNFAKYTSDSTVILKMYKALVRPHLEYAAQVWSPYMVKDIELLEKVQRFALRICSRNYNLSYEELLDLYKTPSLQDRRSFLSLCTFYNIIRGFVFFPPHALPLVSNSRTHHPSFYRTPLAHTSALQHSFMYTAISLFNNLPYDATESTSLNRFKYFISPLFL